MNIDELVRQRLRNALNESGYTQAKLAEKAGIDKINLNRILSGKRKSTSLDTLKKIAEALSLPVSYFSDEQSVNTESIKTEMSVPDPVIHYGSAPPDIATQDFLFIPIFSSKAAATPAVMDIATNEIEGWACIHHSRLSACNGHSPHAFRVKGRSMEPYLMDGDIVAIQPYETAPDYLEKKNIYLVQYIDEMSNDVGLMLKRVFQNGKHLVCCSDNKEFEPLLIDLEYASEHPVKGRVVWMWREM